jgi:hypothetical protein
MPCVASLDFEMSSGLCRNKELMKTKELVQNLQAVLHSCSDFQIDSQADMGCNERTVLQTNLYTNHLKSMKDEKGFSKGSRVGMLRSFVLTLTGNSDRG